MHRLIASLWADPATKIASFRPSTSVITAIQAQLDGVVKGGLIVNQDEGLYLAAVFQGATLRALRKRVRTPDGRRLTQRGLADRLNVSHQAVYNWEKGKNEPEAHMLPLIAREVGCVVGDLFSRSLPPIAPLLLPGPPPDQNFLKELLAALIQELGLSQEPGEARDLAAKIVTEARTPPDSSSGVPAAEEALIRVQTLIRSHTK